MKKSVIAIIIILLAIISGFYFFNKKKIDIKNLSENLENKTISLIKKENFQPEIISQGLSLEIIEPKNKITVNNPSLTIKGKTNPKVEIFINEKELVSDEKGDFETILTLDEGENIITVVASDFEGNYAEKELTITLETPNQ